MSRALPLIVALALVGLATPARAQFANPPPDEDDEPMPAPPGPAPEPATLPPAPASVAPAGAPSPSSAPSSSAPSADASSAASSPDAPSSASAPVTGALRLGLYADSDQTLVYRALATLGGGVGRWTLSGTASVDIVSSASIDVRSSPGLSKVDVTTSASGITSTSGGKMSDRRLSATFGGGWSDGRGHAFAFSTSYANERDYNSIAGGLNGSVDLFERTTTLLGGVTFTYNWIASVLDPTFAQQMYEVGWTAGLAQVLTPSDALRLRYDGAAAVGYQGSPYRNVRFGDWTTSVGDNQRINFANTIGSPDGLPETVPDLRLRHAAVLEWVHSFLDGLALYTQARLGTDSWGVQSVTGAVELRASTPGWRLTLGYRFYAQSDADFYRSKYLLAPSNYAYFTSDKELSRELGHVVRFGVARVLKQPRYSGDTRALLDLSANYMHYDYPDFVLLKSRDSGFLELGVTWDP